MHTAGVAVQRRQTKTVLNNGFNPTFEDGQMGPFTAPDPELSFVRIAVMDDDTGKDRLAAVSCLPIAAIRPGVRHVPLFDARGAEVPYAGVLCRFLIEPAPPAVPVHAALPKVCGAATPCLILVGDVCDIRC